MYNDFAPTASNHNDSTIGEHGFAAMLREDELDLRLTGVVGAPRVDPTRSGLRIEDSYGAAIDTITIAILEDFARRENINHFALMSHPGSRSRDRMRRISGGDECAVSGARELSIA